MQLIKIESITYYQTEVLYLIINSIMYECHLSSTLPNILDVEQKFNDQTFAK